MFTFNTFLKKIGPQEHDPVLKSIIQDVKDGKLSFSPKEGFDIRKFAKSVGFKKADENRKAALHAFLVHYQSYVAGELS